MRVDKINNERILSGFFDVDRAILKFEKFNGEMSQQVTRYNLVRPQAVASLIYLQDANRLILIRQFRYADYAIGGDGWIDEIVAGVMEPDELPLQAIHRETIEETGYEIQTFKPIASVYSSPGITTEFVHIFLGLANRSDLKFSGGGLDSEHEDIQLLEYSPQQARQKIEQGQVHDVKTLLALQYFFLNQVHFSK